MGKALESVVYQITVPANDSVVQTYNFTINTTTYPYDAYNVEAILLNNSERLGSDFEIFDVFPRFDLTSYFPPVYEEESFTATLEITNKLNTTIQDISVLFDHPNYYQTRVSQIGV